MVNMLQISSSKNPGGKKLDDIAYTFIDIASSKTLYEKHQKGKNSHKEKSTMYHMSQYHPPKISSEKIDDMT